MMMRNFCFCVMMTGLFVSQASAQCSAAPNTPAPGENVTFVQTCNELQGYLTNFQNTLNSQWDGNFKSPATFSAELTAADSNQGITFLTSPHALNSVMSQLDGFASAGAEAVTFAVGWPILDPSFYAPNFSQGPPQQDMATVLSFYKNVIAAARQRGMRVLIETSVMFPKIAADLPLAAYYSTLETSGQLPFPAVTAGRAAQAVTIATELQPDWLNLGSEPDTQSSLLGLNTPYTPSQYAQEISSIVSQLRAAGIHGRPLVGAGVGTWDANATDYIAAETGIGPAGTGLDYIDFHIYSINSSSGINFLAVAPGYMDTVHSAGFGAAISEFWMKKVSDEQLAGKSDLGVENQFSNNTTGCIDTFNFWAPLDAQFISELTDLANWKNLYYISPFATEFFFAYQPYSGQDCGQNPSAVLSQETVAETTVLNQGSISLTNPGQSYQKVIYATPTMLSAASYSGGVAPESLVAIFGRGGNLASTTTVATSQPLPTSLGNVSVTVTDSAGASKQLPLLFTSKGQINAAIPPGMANGVAQLSVSAPSGSITSSVNLSAVAPGIFTANQSGSGVAAAQVVTNTPDGKQITNPVFGTGCATGSCQPTPIDLSAGTSALVLYGTGIRHRNSVSDVTVQVGNQTIPALYAGPTSGFTGLDQVNIALPSSLAGSGTVNVTVSIAGTVSNTVTVAFK